nr:unnamed protein product [Callosobruchus chinensis]
MRVKCVASIAPILYRSDKESVLQTQSMLIKDLREALLLGKLTCVRLTFSSELQRSTTIFVLMNP